MNLGAIKKIINKYKTIILYLLFGGFTTFVNIVAYAICTRIFGWNTVVSNLMGWFLAVTFAYVTNRTLVFGSLVTRFSDLAREVFSFFSCRIITGMIDLTLMYLSVDILGANDLVMKMISNLIVIILNYIASKMIIFGKTKVQE